MKTIKTQGIVLKNISYSETSSIVKIYTRETGLISCLVKGAMHKTSKINRYLLHNLALIDIVTGKHKISDLYFISDLCPSYLYKTINNYPVDMKKNCIFMFINDFLIKCIKEGVHSKELFDYIYTSLVTLDTEEDISPDFHIIFIMQIAKLIGFAFPKPNVLKYDYYDIENNIWAIGTPFNINNIPSEYTQYIIKALDLEVNDHISGCNNSSLRKVVTEYILKYYSYHIPEIGQFKSLELLSAVTL